MSGESKLSKRKMTVRTAIGYSAAILVMLLSLDKEFHAGRHVLDSLSGRHIAQTANAAGAGREFVSPEWLRERAGTDTTLIDFSVDGVRYRIPRNYLIHMNNWRGGPQESVSLRVALPSFEPLTKANGACFAHFYRDRPAGCTTIDFDIMKRGIPADTETFGNAIKLYRETAAPGQGPYGYQLFEIGPPNARGQIYRKKSAGGRVVVFRCFISTLTAGTADRGTCDTSSRAAGGDIVHFIFPIQQLKNAEIIEAGLRGLVDGFTRKDEHR